MITFCKKYIRVEVTRAIHHYAKANNKYIYDYNIYIKKVHTS